MVEERIVKLFDEVKELFIKNGYSLCGNKQSKEDVIFCAKKGRVGEHVMVSLNHNNYVRISVRSVMGFFTIPFNSIKLEEEYNGFGIYDNDVRVAAFYFKEV